MELEHIIQPSIDAVPTYDFPIEVESVGDKTINLANIDAGLDRQLIKNGDGTYKLEYNYEHISGDIAVNLEAGKTYNISAEIIESTATYTATSGKQCCLCLFSNKAGETVEYYSALPAPDESGQKVSVTITPNNNHTAIKMYINKTYIDTGGYVIFKNFQIKEGAEDANYEPYGKYKIPVEFTSTLYDFSLNKIAPYNYNNEGLIRYGFDLGILEAGQYTINFEYSEYPTYLYLRWKNANGDFETQYLTTVQTDKQKLPVTFTADGSSNFYVLCASSSINTLQKAKDLWSKITFACLQKGSSIQYKITNLYLNEPLRKINYHEDKIFYADKKVVRRIYNEDIKDVFAKSGLSGSYAIFLSEVTHKPYMDATRGYAMSNKFITHTEMYSAMVGKGGYIQSYITESGKVNTVAYTFDDVNIKQIADAQAKLGSGINVSYAMATPIEEEIEMPDIVLEKGINIFRLHTKTMPNDVQIVYIGK